MLSELERAIVSKIPEQIKNHVKVEPLEICSGRDIYHSSHCGALGRYCDDPRETIYF
jgi:hypothetical protein